MDTVLVWILVSAGQIGNPVTPAVIGHFSTEKDCQYAAAQVYRLSKDKSGMGYLHGICVEAKVVKP